MVCEGHNVSRGGSSNRDREIERRGKTKRQRQYLIDNHIAFLSSNTGSSHGSTPEHQQNSSVTSNGKIHTTMTSVIAVPESDKTKSWDGTAVGGDSGSGDLGMGRPNVAPVSTSSMSYASSEGSSSVTNLDSLPYGNAQNMSTTDSGSGSQYQQYTNQAYFPQRPYPHIIPTPQAGLAQFKGHGVIQGPAVTPVAGYLYPQTGPQASYPMVQTVRYPETASAKTSGDSRSVSPDQSQGGPIPDISTLRQPSTSYQSPYGQVSYQGVIHQPGQGTYGSPYQQPYGTAYAVSQATTTSSTTAYSGHQPVDQVSFQYGYAQGAGQGYTYPYLNTPPPAYSSSAYITQMNSTPPPNAVAGQHGTYQLTQLVPGQGGQGEGDRANSGMAFLDFV